MASDIFLIIVGLIVFAQLASAVWAIILLITEKFL